MHARTLLYTTGRICNIQCLKLIKWKRNLHSCYLERNCFPSTVTINSVQYRRNSTLKCWNCNFENNTPLFCSKCRALQEPPENLTYFNMMDIPENYNVSVTDIHNKYRELQKLLHPDKFSNKSEREKVLSENLSSLVNKAYNTLTNPLKRGLYMLELNNIVISEETDNVNSNFLMEIMEKNEEIDDAAIDKDKIIRLLRENEAILNTLSKEVADAFDNKDIQKAEALIVKMKYYNSIHTRLRKLKHDLGIIQ